MTLQRIGGPASAFDQARQQIAEWEQLWRETRGNEPRIILLMQDDNDIHMTLAGRNDKPSHLAGLCLVGAHMALE